jgi:hypothetical protein
MEDYMKSIKKLLMLGIMLCFAVSCSNDGGGSGTQDVNLSGTFGSTGEFTISNSAAPTGYANPAAATSFLGGKLKHGAIIFNLAGVYDPETQSYVLSAVAADEKLIYQISGSIDEQKASVIIDETTDNTNWIQNGFDVNTVGQSITISDAADPQSQDSLPTKWVGMWSDGSEVFMYAPYGLIAIAADGEIFPMKFVDVERNSDISYTVTIHRNWGTSDNGFLKQTITELSTTKIEIEEHNVNVSNTIAEIPITPNGNGKKWTMTKRF